MSSAGPTEVHPGLVSIIVPVFNRAAMLAEAVASAEAQSYRPIEVILVDDGSTDGTGAACDEMACRNSVWIRSLHQTNAGPGAAREAGRRAARGEFLQYLDSDDWMHPRKLELQVEALRREPGAGVCYCRTQELRIGGPVPDRPTLRTGEPINAIFPAFLAGRLWQTVTPLWRRSASDRIGPWTSLRIEEDMEYDARAGAEGVKPVWCPEWLAEHRHHDAPRASAGGTGEPAKLADRARAHELIYRHAVRAGVGSSVPEMQRYARELFLLARQCGAAGLGAEAEAMFRLARKASGPVRGRGADFRAYSAVAGVFGWERAGRLACFLDKFRPEPAR